MSNLPLPGFHFDWDVSPVAAPVARETFDKKQTDAKCDNDRDTDRPGPMPCECAWKLQYYGVLTEKCSACRSEDERKTPEKG